MSSKAGSHSRNFVRMRLIDDRTFAVRGEELDDTVLADRKADIDPVPIGPADVWPQGQPAEDQALVRLLRQRRACRLGSFDGALETPDQNVHAAQLVDEVGRAPFES